MARGKSSVPTVFIATESGSAEVDGQNLNFVKGVTRVRAGHALLRQLPNFFAPADESLSYEYEDAQGGPDVQREAIVVGNAFTPEAAPVVVVESEKPSDEKA